MDDDIFIIYHLLEESRCVSVKPNQSSRTFRTPKATRDIVIPFTKTKTG